MRCWWFVALAACYRPSPPEGAPCANGIDCPAPLVCDRGVCVRDPLDRDASIDAAIDAAPPTGCVPMWLAGSVTTSPVLAPNINSPAADVTPSITSDGATMYFSSTRDDPNAEIYRATRVGTTFTNVTVVPDLSSPAADGMVSISADGRSAFVSTERAGAPTAGRNYWEATRASTADPFGNFTTAPFVNVNSAGNEFEIWASPDRLRIYVSSSGNTDQTIAIATRTSVTAPFGTPAVLPELNGATTECCLALSSDERVIVFRTGANETLYATRSSPTGPFSTPRLVPGAAPLTGVNLHMALSPDACNLYFSTTRTGGVGGFDIWTTAIGPGS